MRILFTLPHVFNPSKGGKNASTTTDPTPRIDGCTRCVSALHQVFGGGRYEIDFANWQARPVETAMAQELDVVVLTTQGLHLLDQIDLPKEMFRRLDLEVEPMMLEFECQRVLAEALGRYDYYCFLEDDCVIHDPWFFQKLQWFTKRFGNACLLQPNRYEVGSLTSAVRKLYPDGNLKVASTAEYQNLAEQPELEAEYLDSTVRFKRPSNPHAACYFLNAAQMKYWTNQSHFLDRSTEWIGPLESAATLGIMRTFRIYKAAAPCPEFLELEHHGCSYLATVGFQVPIVKSGVRRKIWPFPL